MDGIYDQLLGCGYTPLLGDNGGWLGPEHEFWLLSEQFRLYGPVMGHSPVARRALLILSQRLGYQTS